MPTGAAPRTGTVARGAGALFSSAAGRVAARFRELGPETGSHGAGDIGSVLAQMERRVEQILDGADPEPVRVWATSQPLAAPLAQAVGHELVRDPVTDPDDAVVTVEILRALAQIRGEPPAARTVEAGSLEDVMGGADAFELLVEIVHDFRSPLTSILFLSEALRDGHSGPVNETQRSQLGLMYGAAFELTSIASDVLDLARRERSLTDDDVELFSLPELFSTVERMVRPMVEERGLELKTLVPERAQARGHVHALSRVLLNLTTNALKFTDQGSVELGVRAAPGGRFEFWVRDTGRGISPEKQKELFKPFRRRRGESKPGLRFSGSGVGLSITRRLLRGMNSELVLDFSDESGTQFSFVVPADSNG